MILFSVEEEWLVFLAFYNKKKKEINIYIYTSNNDKDSKKVSVDKHKKKDCQIVDDKPTYIFILMIEKMRQTTIFLSNPTIMMNAVMGW